MLAALRRLWWRERHPCEYHAQLQARHRAREETELIAKGCEPHRAHILAQLIEVVRWP